MLGRGHDMEELSLYGNVPNALNVPTSRRMFYRQDKKIQSEFVSASTSYRTIFAIPRVFRWRWWEKKEEREKEKEKRNTNLSPAGFEPAPPEEDCPPKAGTTNKR